MFLLRFSHSPLIDEDDEEDEAKEPMLNEAFGKRYVNSASSRVWAEAVNYSSILNMSDERACKLTNIYVSCFSIFFELNSLDDFRF